MNPTKPSSTPGQPMPPQTEPSASLPDSSDSALIEQLSEQVEQLTQANEELRSQLAAALAAEHTPLFRFGEGTKRCTLAARSIGAMYLKAELKLNTLTPEETGRFMVAADSHSLTELLPTKEALAALTLAEAQWEAALTPPPRK